jgi:hypothetical protein
VTSSRISGLSAMAATIALAACQGSGQPAAATVAPPTTVARTSAPTASPTALPEHVVAQWSVASPTWIYASVDSIWVPGHSSGMTTRIDPVTNTVLGDVPTETGPLLSDTVGFGSRWITTTRNTLERLDPTHPGTILASITLADGALDILNGVVVTKAAVWVYHSDTTMLIKVDPATNRIVSRTPWATLIDEASAHSTVPAGKGSDFLWLHIVGDEGGAGLTKGLLRIDPTSGAGLTFLPWSADHAGDGPITVTDEAVWHSAGGFTYRVDVATNQIDATYPVEPGIVHVAVGFGSVWLANYERSVVQRLDVAP